MRASIAIAARSARQPFEASGASPSWLTLSRYGRNVCSSTYRRNLKRREVFRSAVKYIENTGDSSTLPGNNMTANLTNRGSVEFLYVP
jgi:hypothetical protein